MRHSFDAATGQAAIHLMSAWATESGLALGEDDCGIWQDNAPENLATLRKIALNLLRQDKKN